MHSQLIRAEELKRLASEHKIIDVPVVPGVAIIQMAFMAAEQYVHAPVYCLRNIIFRQPLRLASENRSVRVKAELKRSPDGLRFKLLSAPSGLSPTSGPVSTWTENASAVIVEGSAQQPRKIDVAATVARFSQAVQTDELYKWFGRAGLEYGPSFRTMGRAWRSDDKVLAELSVGDDSFQSFRLHPGLLDGALQSLGLWAFIHLSKDADLFVPFMIDEIVTSGVPSRKLWSLASVTQQAGQGFAASRGNVTMFADSGDVIAELRGVSGRAMPLSLRETETSAASRFSADAARTRTHGEQLERFLRVPVWTTRPLTETCRAVRQPCATLLFDDEQGLGGSLAEAERGFGRRVVRITTGEKYCRRNSDHYELRATNVGDYVTMLETLAGEIDSEFRILHLWGYSVMQPGDGSIECLRASLEKGAFSLLNIISALTRKRYGVFDLRVVTSSTQEIVDAQAPMHPEHATLAGLLRTFALEQKSIRCQAIEVNPPPANVKTLADLLLLEMDSEPGDIEVAYSGQVRYVPSLSPFPKSEAHPPAGLLREGGVYLITGGFGGIGTELATWLRTRWRAKLILVSRGQSRNVQTQLEGYGSAGADVLRANGDMSDLSQVTKVVQEARSHFGQINGVFHAAGVLRDGLLANKDPSHLEDVFRPKIYGAFNLDRALADEAVDFLILFASVVGLVGNIGQADYVAANRYLDSFAAWRTANGRRTLSVDWGPWAGCGMSGRIDSKLRAAGIEAMKPATALAALERAMQIPLSQVIIAPEELYERYLLTQPRFIADAEPPFKTVRLLKSSNQVDRRDLLEGALIARISSILHVPAHEIRAENHFSDLGIDSILAVDFLRELERRSSIHLSPALLLESSTIRDFTDVLLHQLNDAEINLLIDTRTDRTPVPIHAQALLPQTIATSGTGLVGSGESYGGDPTKDYGIYGRPALVERLNAAGLGKAYIRAKRDLMTFERSGESIQVIDLVGGYGATLFGHNHPELSAYAIELIQRDLPNHAQGSIRTSAGRVGRALSERLKSSTQKDYVVTLLNTGAEAVEAAIKHARLEYESRAKQVRRDWARTFALLRHEQSAKDGLRIDRALQEAIQKYTHSLPVTLDEAYGIVTAHNEAVLAIPPSFLSLVNAFHGKTLGAASLTYTQAHSDLATNRFGNTVWLQTRDLGALAHQTESLTDNLYFIDVNDRGVPQLFLRRWCSIIGAFVEPVQGEGGVRVLTSEFAGALQAAASIAGFPIIVDEIQSGMGRCGSFMASDTVGLRGDYYCFGKSLGGGLSKIAALAVDSARYQGEFGLVHTSTFAEDDFGARMALRAMEILDRDHVAEKCRSIGSFIKARLKALQSQYPSVIADVRGLGTMIGLEFADQSSSESAIFRLASDELGHLVAGYLLNEENIRVMPTASAPRTIRLEPSAYITEEDLDCSIQALDRLCRIISYANAGRLLRHLSSDEPLNSSELITDWRGKHPVRAWASPQNEPQVAFFMHLEGPDDMLFLDPSIAEIPASRRPNLIRAFHRVLGARITHQYRVQSASGAWVHLRIFGFLASSDLLEEAIRTGDIDWLEAQIDQALDLVSSLGCTAVGFGGHLSIATGNCRTVVRPDLAMTSGNSLTAATIVESLRETCRIRGVDLRSARVAIVGAAGNIGSAITRLIARDSSQLLLLCRPSGKAQLRSIADEIYNEALETIRFKPGKDLTGLAQAIGRTETVRRAMAEGDPHAPVALSLYEQLTNELVGNANVKLSDDPSAIAGYDLIVCVSSSAKPILQPEHIGIGPVILCDAAVPPDVAPSVAVERPQALVFSGGIVKLPCGSQEMMCGRSLEPGCIFACLGETLLLGWAGIQDHFSLGSINIADIDRALALSKTHGLAPLMPD